MSMGPKDYNAIAGALKNIRKRNKMTTRDSTLLAVVTLALADYMQSCNAQFSRQRFLEAAAHPAFETEQVP